MGSAGNFVSLYVAPRLLRFRQNFLGHVSAVFHGECIDDGCLQLNWRHKVFPFLTSQKSENFMTPIQLQAAVVNVFSVKKCTNMC